MSRCDPWMRKGSGSSRLFAREERLECGDGFWRAEPLAEQMAFAARSDARSSSGGGLSNLRDNATASAGSAQISRATFRASVSV